LLNREGLYDFLKLDQHTYHLFRTMINIAEFNFKDASKLSVEYCDFDASLLLEENTAVGVTTRQLFDVLHFEKQMIYLDSKRLMCTYLESLHQLIGLCNRQTCQIMFDHLLQL